MNAGKLPLGGIRILGRQSSKGWRPQLEVTLSHPIFRVRGQHGAHNLHQSGQETTREFPERLDFSAAGHTGIEVSGMAPVSESWTPVATANVRVASNRPVHIKFLDLVG